MRTASAVRSARVGSSSMPGRVATVGWLKERGATASRRGSYNMAAG